ncbi:MAG: hypothetical protein LBP22_12970 [Deltaproteobacteria bacterium]|nr:hypothetical protein [Deltaproteobacteria bacterium]
MTDDRTAELAPRSHSDYLESQGVSVPHRQTWQDIPANTQQWVDTEILVNIFELHGEDLLAVGFTNSNASPTAGVNDLAAEEANGKTDSLFLTVLS